MKAAVLGVAAAMCGILAATAEPEAAPGRGARQRPEFAMPGLEHGEEFVEMVFRNEKLAGELALTDSQKLALKEMHFKSKEEGIELNASLEKAALAQAKLMMEDDPDEAAVLKAVEETGRVRTEIAKKRVAYLMQIRRSLTPEQRSRLRDMMRERMEKRERGQPRPEGAEMPRGPQRGAGPGAGPQGPLPPPSQSVPPPPPDAPPPPPAP